MSITSWQNQGIYEYEYDQHGYTGWCRFVGSEPFYCEAYRTKTELAH